MINHCGGPYDPGVKENQKKFSQKKTKRISTEGSEARERRGFGQKETKETKF